MSGRILVLGAGGRVGRLLRAAWEIRPASLAPLFQSRQTAREGDITYRPGVDPPEALIAAASASDLRALVALWGVTAPAGAGELGRNTDLALEALDLARALGVPRVVMMSSAAIYRAAPDHPPFREQDDADPPASAYGRAKRDMERAVAAWSARAGGDAPAIVLLRLANVMGADMLADAIRGSDPERPLRLDRFPDGATPRRSYLSPLSLAAALEAIAEGHAAPGRFSILNLADNSEGVEMQAVLDAALAQGCDVSWQHQPAPPAAIRRVCLDSTRFGARYPRARSRFRSTAAQIVADWLATEDALR